MEQKLETRAEPVVYLVYVESHLILEPRTLLGKEWKQILSEQGSFNCF